MNTRDFCIGLFVTALMTACVPKKALEHDNAELDQLMNAKQAKVEECYKNLKAARPDLKSGSLTIRAEPNPDGSLSYISLVKGFPGSQPLFECIREELSISKTDPTLTRGPLEMTWNFH
jgi:hypothetical protein